MPIYIIEQNKVIQGGITAIYGYDALYKVQAVSVIPPLRKVHSDEKKHQSKQNQSGSPRKLFAEVLDEACEKEESKQKNIHILTSGYTRNALPYYNFINMREYC